MVSLLYCVKITAPDGNSMCYKISDKKCVKLCCFSPTTFSKFINVTPFPHNMKSLKWLGSHGKRMHTKIQEFWKEPPHNRSYPSPTSPFYGQPNPDSIERLSIEGFLDYWPEWWSGNWIPSSCLGCSLRTFLSLHFFAIQTLLLERYVMP